MASPVPVAAVQLSSQASVDENMGRVRARVEEAASRGARVVLLPENFALMGEREEDRARIAEPLEGGPGGPIGAALAEIARASRVALVAGGMPERSGDPARPFNTCAVFSEGGELVVRYRKIHLFDVDIASGGGGTYRESACTSPGDAPVVVELAGLKVGLSICYDLRFPELYRALAAKGADLLVVPAAFTLATGKDHWQVLLRARAIESQAYVLAAGQWGKHPRGRHTFGKSCVVDPWGEIVAQASEGEGVVVGGIDLEYLRRVRESLPCLGHRRL